MPGTTSSGLPYPLPTEPVRDGAVATQNLATELTKRQVVLGTARGAVVYDRLGVTSNSGGFAAIARPAALSVLKGVSMEIDTTFDWQVRIAAFLNASGGFDLALINAANRATVPNGAFLVHITYWGEAA